MQPKVRKIRASQPVLLQLKRVAAYARVSTDKDAALHSLSAQVSYYSDYIQQRPEWLYAGVYADEALTGTNGARAEFQRLLEDCRAGKIDIVITKSISRFARNTVTLLETVRELKGLGIDVYFEKEGIHSISGDGELMLSILASFAQEESRSVSENCKWRIRNNFKEGLPHGFSILGYRLDGDQLVIVPREAEIVKMIFNDYLDGMGKNAIMKKLNAAGIKTKRGHEWLESTVDRILRNEKYAGDMLLQKAYIADHIGKKKKINRGVLPRYGVQNSHPPIIDRYRFDRVQEILKGKAASYHPDRGAPSEYPFSGRVVCGRCGKNYRRKITGSGTRYAKWVWICPTFNRHGKAACPAQQIPEDVLITVAAKILGMADFDEGMFQARIQRIVVPEAGILVFVFSDGSEIEARWQNPSRQDSWTEEMRQQAREHRIRGNERKDAR